LTPSSLPQPLIKRLGFDFKVAFESLPLCQLTWQIGHESGLSFQRNGERALINAAKPEAMNQTVRPAGNSVRL